MNAKILKYYFENENVLILLIGYFFKLLLGLARSAVLLLLRLRLLDDLRAYLHTLEREIRRADVQLLDNLGRHRVVDTLLEDFTALCLVCQQGQITHGGGETARVSEDFRVRTNSLREIGVGAIEPCGLLKNGHLLNDAL